MEPGKIVAGQTGENDTTHLFFETGLLNERKKKLLLVIWERDDFQAVGRSRSNKK